MSSAASTPSRPASRASSKASSTHNSPNVSSAPLVQAECASSPPTNDRVNPNTITAESPTAASSALALFQKLPTIATTKKGALRAAIEGNAPVLEAYLRSLADDDGPQARNTTDEEEDKDAKGASNTAVPAAVLEALEETHDRGGISGTFLFWGAYHSHSNIIGLVQSRYPAFFAQQATPTAQQLLAYQRDIPAVSLLVRNGTPAAIVDEPRGSTALHILCRRRKPPASLIAELISTYDAEVDDLDALDGEGFSPLHLVAIHSIGVDGRVAAQALIKKGADPMQPSASGGNARTLATNPHVRRAIGFQALHGRAVLEVDAEVKASIDACKSAADFPPMPTQPDEEPPRVPSALGAADEAAEAMRPPARRLNKEGTEAMVKRLYDYSLQVREENAARRRAALEPAENRRLTEEEQDAVAERLWRGEQERRQEKYAELLEQYAPEREPNPLDEDTQAESAARLCDQSLERKRHTMRVLDEKYWPAAEKKVLAKDAVAACAMRLHDDCATHTQKKFDALSTKYLDRERGRFAGGRKITPDEIKEMGDRLSKRNR